MTADTDDAKPDLALLRMLCAEVDALRDELSSAQHWRPIHATSPTHGDVALDLAARGADVLADLHAHLGALDYERIAQAMAERDALTIDVRALLDVVVAEFSRGLDANAALMTSMAALAEFADEMAVALAQLRACVLEGEARLDAFGELLGQLEELLQCLLRAQCEETDLLRLARAIVELVRDAPDAEPIDQLWEHLERAGAGLRPLATASRMSSVLPSARAELRALALSRSSQLLPAGMSHGAELCASAPGSAERRDASESARGDSLARRALSLTQGSLAGERTLGRYAELPTLRNRTFRTTADTVGARASPLHSAVAELRARCALRPAGVRGLDPLLAIACCQSRNDALVLGALARLPLVPARAPACALAPPHGERASGGVVTKRFELAHGAELQQEVTARALVGEAACTTIVAAYVHADAVWLELKATERGALADAVRADGLCGSWPRDLAPWRVLDAFRALAGTVARGHEGGLVFGEVLSAEHLIIDSSRQALLLNSLWRTGAGGAAERAHDMLRFGRCLYAALAREPPPDHPQDLHAQLAQAVRDPPTRELLWNLLASEPELRLSAAQTLASGCFASAFDRLRASGALVGLEQRTDVWTMHVRCIAQVSAERGVLRITASREQIVTDVLRAFSALRSTEELLRPMLASFERHERIASDQGGVTRELFTAFFERLRADAETRAEHRLLDLGEGESSDGAVFLPASTASASDSEALGRVLLKLLLVGLPCPLRFAPSLLNNLACAANESTVDDLARFDARAARSIRQIMAASAVELEEMALFFGADEDPQRVDEQVTLSNVHEFAKAKIGHILERQRSVQIERLTFGFRAVPLLDAHLDLLGVQGISSLLFDSASRHLCARTIVAGLEWADWPAASRVPEQLERLLEQLDQDSLRRFLRLATAQTVMPTAGFEPRISIQRCPPSAALPVGSTCFHILRIPDYATEAELKAKMRIALDNVGEADFGYV